MSYQDKAPFIQQDHGQVTQLIQALEAGKNKAKKGFKCRKSTFRVHDAKHVEVDSWKFQDWDYKRDDLPTYARGLFTYKNSAGKNEIATRGYDKFFNVDEVNDTKWRNVETNTRGPYELSVKENGCIIFLSGLDNGSLLVCSKHSTGPRGDVELSHAMAGEKWVERHLASVGKTRKDLAQELRRRNVTAVGELCDDSFEEHVLAYDEKTSGLYLHGMNVNVPEFATYSGSMVHKFADEWGFKKADYLVKDDIDQVKRFLDECAETGSYAGRDTEGFVVRCQKRSGDSSGGPYEDWFFKYKFDEPYLMYRQWREATKAVIAGRAPYHKKHAKITEEYLVYARRKFATNPGLSKQYMKNHGIIQLREDFLNDIGKKGSDIIRQELEEGHAGSEATRNIVLVPIATIGCGKTTVALALSKLFGWGHIQNDNITGKKNRPQTFATQVSNELSLKPVVVADRNNHQKRERAQLTEDLSRVVTDVQFVALHYIHHPKEQKLPEIRKATQARVLDRGDNHQTIQAGSKSREEILGIMEGFLHRFEPLDTTQQPDNAFDEVIDLNVLADSRHNLELTVNALRAAYPKLIPDPPSPEDLDNAIQEALSSYTVDLKHDLSFRSNKNNNNKNSNSKGPKPPNDPANPQQQPSAPTARSLKHGPAYFSLILPGTQVRDLLDRTFYTLPPEQSAFYTQLSKTRRVQPGFHVTLVHRAEAKAHGALWAAYMARLDAAWRAERAASGAAGEDSPKLGTCRVRLERVVWDKRVMCFVARLLDDGWESMAGVKGRAVHITIGTAAPDIKPKESNDLVERWERGEDGIGEVDVGGMEFVAEGRAVVQ